MYVGRGKPNNDKEIVFPPCAACVQTTMILYPGWVPACQQARRNVGESERCCRGWEVNPIMWGVGENNPFCLAVSSDRSTVYSYLSMKMGCECRFVDKSITSSDVSKSKSDKFNLERSNFLAARVMRRWSKLADGTRHSPFLGAFKTRCVFFQIKLPWSSCWEKIHGLCTHVRLRGYGGPSYLEVWPCIWEGNWFLLNVK